MVRTQIMTIHDLRPGQAGDERDLSNGCYRPQDGSIVATRNHDRQDTIAADAGPPKLPPTLLNDSARTDGLRRPGAYVLGTGLRAQERLEISESIYGPHTRRLFEDLRRSYFTRNEPLDMAVIGCGSGAQVPALCDFVGENGSLWLTDISREQIDLVRERVDHDNRQTMVAYGVADVYDMRPPRRFDIVYARFLLVHLENPADALRQMAACLRPGGLLVCDEHDVSTIRSCPAASALERFRSMLCKLAARRGVDFTLGAKLGSLYDSVGLSSSDASMWGATLLVREQPAKSLAVLSLKEGRNSYVEDGIASPSEMDALIADMEAIDRNQHIAMSVGSQWQMWARVPATSRLLEKASKLRISLESIRDDDSAAAFVARVNRSVQTPVGTWAVHTRAALQADRTMLIQDSVGCPLGYAAVSSGYLSFLALLPQHRRKGYGRAVMHELLALCDGSLEMHVRASNASARHFYDGLRTPKLSVASAYDGVYDNGDGRLRYTITRH